MKLLEYLASAPQVVAAIIVSVLIPIYLFIRRIIKNKREQKQELNKIRESIFNAKSIADGYYFSTIDNTQYENELLPVFNTSTVGGNTVEESIQQLSDRLINGEQNILLISGMAFTGKSVAVKYVWKRLAKNKKNIVFYSSSVNIDYDEEAFKNYFMFAPEELCHKKLKENFYLIFDDVLVNNLSKLIKLLNQNYYKSKNIKIIISIKGSNEVKEGYANAINARVKQYGYNALTAYTQRNNLGETSFELKELLLKPRFLSGYKSLGEKNIFALLQNFFLNCCENNILKIPDELKKYFGINEKNILSDEKILASSRSYMKCIFSFCRYLVSREYKSNLFFLFTEYKKSDISQKIKSNYNEIMQLKNSLDDEECFKLTVNIVNVLLDIDVVKFDENNEISFAGKIYFEYFDSIFYFLKLTKVTNDSELCSVLLDVKPHHLNFFDKCSVEYLFKIMGEYDYNKELFHYNINLFVQIKDKLIKPCEKIECKYCRDKVCVLLEKLIKTNESNNQSVLSYNKQLCNCDLSGHNFGLGNNSANDLSCSKVSLKTFFGENRKPRRLLHSDSGDYTVFVDNANQVHISFDDSYKIIRKSKNADDFVVAYSKNKKYIATMQRGANDKFIIRIDQRYTMGSVLFSEQHFDTMAIKMLFSQDGDLLLILTNNMLYIFELKESLLLKADYALDKKYLDVAITPYAENNILKIALKNVNTVDIFNYNLSGWIEKTDINYANKNQNAPMYDYNNKLYYTVKEKSFYYEDDVPADIFAVLLKGDKVFLDKMQSKKMLKLVYFDAENYAYITKEELCVGKKHFTASDVGLSNFNDVYKIYYNLPYALVFLFTEKALIKCEVGDNFKSTVSMLEAKIIFDGADVYEDKALYLTDIQNENLYAFNISDDKLRIFRKRSLIKSDVNDVAVAFDKSIYCASNIDYAIKKYSLKNDEYICDKIYLGHTNTINFIDVLELIQEKNDNGYLYKKVDYSNENTFRLILSASDDRTVKIFDKNNCIATLPELTDNCKYASFDSTFNYLTASCYDSNIYIWKREKSADCFPRSFSKWSLIYPNGEQVTSHSPDNMKVITALERAFFSPINLSKRIKTAKDGGSSIWINSSEFSSNNKLQIVTGSWDGYTRIFSLKHDKLKFIKPKSFKKFPSNCNGIKQASYTPDGNHIVSISRDGSLRFYNNKGLPLIGGTKFLTESEGDLSLSSKKCQVDKTKDYCPYCDLDKPGKDKKFYDENNCGDYLNGKCKFVGANIFGVIDMRDSVARQNMRGLRSLSFVDNNGLYMAVCSWNGDIVLYKVNIKQRIIELVFNYSLNTGGSNVRAIDVKAIEGKLILASASDDGGMACIYEIDAENKTISNPKKILNYANLFVAGTDMSKTEIEDSVFDGTSLKEILRKNGAKL